MGTMKRKRKCGSKAYIIFIVTAAVIGVQTLLIPFMMHRHLTKNPHQEHSSQSSLAAPSFSNTYTIDRESVHSALSPAESTTASRVSDSRWRPSDYTVVAGEKTTSDGRQESSQYDYTQLELREMQRSEILTSEEGSAAQSMPSSNSTKQSDGTFSGYPVYYVSGNAQSLLSRSNGTKSRQHSSGVHCVGENFQSETAWVHKSCQFRNLCFDTREKEFIIFRSTQDVQVDQALWKYRNDDVSTHGNNGIFAWLSSLFSAANSLRNRRSSMQAEEAVAIGGINPKWTWGEGGVPRLKWFPKVIVTDDFPESYYELDPEVVLIPFHSFYAANPGHLVWDDFLPIYTLLRMFSILNGRQPLLMRYVLQGEPLWATCDMDEQKKHLCSQMFGKFLPLFGLTLSRFSTNQHFQFVTKGEQKSTLVCSKQGAAGLGMLTDHGTKMHGVRQEDYNTMHNHGRGALLLEFRNFMMSNLHVPPDSGVNGPPFSVTFALGSSQKKERHFSFSKQITAMEEAFGKLVDLRTVHMSRENLKNQVKIASESTLYVTACGGGAVTATFLPPGASLILFYTEVRDGAARLDWDILNNMAWIRTHWLPAKTMDDEVDLFVQLIARELDLVPHFRDR